MSEPSVSVALCSYNMAAFIGEQLDSIARQTRLPNELVVSDDGSQDRTVDIVRSFAAKAPFDVRIVRNEVPLGCNKNFEQAISLCTGDIIFLCDHDDVWRTKKIELLLGLMREDSVGAAFGDAEVVAADLSPCGFTMWDTCNFNPERRIRFADGQEFSELIVNNVMQGAAAAFKSSFRPAIMPIPLDWPHDYWIALIVAASSRIRFTERHVLDYRQHGGNLLGAGMPYRPVSPPNRLKRLRRQADRWIEKLRSPARYYDEKLAKIRSQFAPLSVLRERLAQLDPHAAGPAVSIVEKEVARLIRQQGFAEQKRLRWVGAAPGQGPSRASDTEAAR